MKQIYFFMLLLLSILWNYSKANSDVFCKIKQDTTVSKKHLELGITKYKNKDYMGAIAEFESAVKNDASNWKAYRYKGDAEFELNKYEESIQDYTKALTINKSDMLCYKGRAEAYRMSENYFQEAVEDYTTVIQMDPNDAVMYFGRASSYYGLSKFQESIEDYTEVIQFHPKHPMSYAKRGMAYLNYGKYRETVKDFNKYLSLGGDDPYGAYFYRGRAYLYLSKTDSALTDFKNNEKRFPDNAKTQRYLAMTYAAKNDSIMANRHFEQSIKLNPNDPDTYYFWASAELKFGNYFKTIELLETGLEKLKSEPSFDAYYRLGWAKAEVRDTLGAMKAFNKAIAIDSNRYELYERRAIFLANDLQYKEQVIKDFTSILRIFGDTSVVNSGYLYMARSYVKFFSGDTLGAKSDINKAIEIMPKEPNYYIYRAVYNFHLTTDKELILKDLDKAISLDNNNWEAYLGKTAVYNRYENDHRKACENLKKGIKNGAKVYKEIEDYICNGRLPKDGIVPNLFFYLTPKLKNRGLTTDNKKINNLR